MAVKRVLSLGNSCTPFIGVAKQDYQVVAHQVPYSHLKYLVAIDCYFEVSDLVKIRCLSPESQSLLFE
ncbi:hypothetical protein [Candidatus Nitrosocosmicus sp. R]